MDTNREHVARAASLLADPLRLEIVLALIEGSKTVQGLVAKTGALQPRISSHLAILREAGWVVRERAGRQTLYCIGDDSIAGAIAAIGRTPAKFDPDRASRNAAAAIRKAGPAMQQARSCYDHLAGIHGVQLCDHLLTEGWIEPREDDSGLLQPSFVLTKQGERELTARGVELPAPGSNRRFAYACPDWTERKPHVAGSLGAAILTALERQGYVQPTEGSRTLQVTKEITGWLEQPASR